MVRPVFISLVALTDMHADRIVRHALPHHNCGAVFWGVGGHPEAAQEDPPGVILDAHGGNPGANITVQWQTLMFF